MLANESLHARAFSHLLTSAVAPAILILGLGAARAAECPGDAADKIFGVALGMAPGIEEGLKCRRDPAHCKGAPLKDGRIAYQDHAGIRIDFRGDADFVKAECSFDQSGSAAAVWTSQKFVKSRALTASVADLIGRLGDRFYKFNEAETRQDAYQCVGSTKSGFDKPEGDVVRVRNVSCRVRALDDAELGPGYEVAVCVGACQLTTDFSAP